MKKLVVFIPILCMTTTPLLAQQSQQHFLWFCGHWSKTKKNTFITTSCTDTVGGKTVQMSGGSAITVAPGGNVTIASPGIDDWNNEIDDGEKSVDKSINKLLATETQLWAIHFNELALPTLQDIKNQWQQLKITKSQNILSPQQHNSGNSGNSEMYKIESDWCTKVESDYNDVISFYKAHKKDNPSDYHNPPPPEFVYTCHSCDTNLVNQEDKEAEQYAENFSKPESDLIKKGLAIEKSLAQSGLAHDVIPVGDPNYDLYNSLFHQDKSNPSESGPCDYLDRDELNQAVQFLVTRVYQRVVKLVNDHKNDVNMVFPVVKTYLEVARSAKLMGINVNNNFDELAAMEKMVFDYNYNKLVKNHDWSELGNIPFIFGLERQYELLSGNTSGAGNTIKQIFKILNSFQLNIEMNIRIKTDPNEPGYFMMAHLKGKAKIAPEFKYGTDSCYEWTIIEDQPNSLGEPVKKTDQKIDVQLLSTSAHLSRHCNVSYTGTKKWSSSLVRLRLDYCYPGKDTISLSGFVSDPLMAGTWENSCGGSPTWGIFGIDKYFMDMGKIKSESGTLASQGKADAAEGEKLAAQMKALASKMGNGYNPSQIGNFQKMMSMANQARSLFTNQTISVLYLDFPLQSQNSSNTLVNQKFDVKQVNPLVASKGIFDYGYYTVDIEYKN